MEQSIQFLKEVDLFSLLNNQELTKIEGILLERKVAKGELLFNEGEEGQELYVVREGAVVGTIQLPNGKERTVGTFAPGDFFGEMAIIENDRRSATCRVQRPGKLFTLHKDQFYSLMVEDAEISRKVMYRMLKNTSERLTHVSSFLSDMIRFGNDARKRSITDEYTGCYNRRFMDETMVELLEGVTDAEHSLILAMVDLDYFRQINDGYSHELGDQIILAVAEIFQNTLRPIDFVVRYGGDEFSLIFPYTDKSTAYEVAEKIRQEVAKIDLLRDLDGPIHSTSISIGLASYPQDATEIDSLNKKADEALYQAKEGGRNRVVALGRKVE